MTNAIARWQSKAPMPTNDRLEQAYADRLEGEMQEMALQLLKVKKYGNTLFNDIVKSLELVMYLH